MRAHLFFSLSLALFFFSGCSSMFDAGSEDVSEAANNPEDNSNGIAPYAFSNCDIYSEPLDDTEGFHVDVSRGSDEAGDGSRENPYASIQKVLEVMSGGDTAILHEGNYGDIRVGVKECEGGGSCPDNRFNDWITIRAAQGENVEIGNLAPDVITEPSLQVGSDGCHFRTNGCGNSWSIDDGEGVGQSYVRFQGIHFLKNINIEGSHHVEIVHSKVEIPGPWNGSAQAIDRSAIGLKIASDVLVECNEVTNSGWGISVGPNTYRNVIRNNHIHNITQDGVVVVSANDLLIEGNRIENLDDGIGDDAGLSWNRHCDGIHMYPIVASNKQWLHNITIRGNQIFHVESMGIMVNKKSYEPFEFQFHNVTIENNIFGLARGPVIHASKPFNGLVIRNNSVVAFEGDGFQSRYRWVNNESSAILLPDSNDPVVGVQIYNNIFHDWPSMGGFANYDRIDHNLLYGGGSAYTGLGTHSIRLTTSPFENPTSFDGVVEASSPAIDAGTQLDETFYAIGTLLPYDFFGTDRDVRPDIGAYEVPDRNPSHQSFPTVEPSNPQFYVDNFDSAFLMKADPFQHTSNTAALSWGAVSGYEMFLVRPQDDNNILIPANCDSGHRFIVSGESFSDARVSFDMLTTHSRGGESSVFLYQDADNYYMLDLSGGEFIRRMNGSNSVLSSNSELQVSNAYSSNPEHEVEVTVNPSPSGIGFVIHIDGSQVFSYTDTNGTARSTFTGGKIGFTRQNDEGCHGGKYDNVVVEIL